MHEQCTDVTIIGAGPAGSVAAAMLAARGWDVVVLERSHFPRFSIGESLLPQCMDLLEAADMLAPVKAAGFQTKRGVVFAEGERHGHFSFTEQFTPGWSWTWQVLRADFDHILINQAAKRGAEVRYGQTVTDCDFNQPDTPCLTVTRDDIGADYRLYSRFVCDASGVGRVLPRLLELDQPTGSPPRAALFTHVTDHIADPAYCREDIIISIHPDNPDLWYWLIGLAGGRASVGVAGSADHVLCDSDRASAHLQALIAAEPHLSHLLENADFDGPARQMHSYARSVQAMYGRGYALLGNAGGFIDPIFSSGVTVALKSALLGAEAVDRQLRGQSADWETRFEAPLSQGLRVFRSFVDAWYRGTLKHVLFNPDPDPQIRLMLVSILAGYVWDTSNPYVAAPERRLRALCDLCSA